MVLNDLEVAGRPYRGDVNEGSSVRVATALPGEASRSDGFVAGLGVGASACVGAVAPTYENEGAVRGWGRRLGPVSGRWDKAAVMPESREGP